MQADVMTVLSALTDFELYDRVRASLKSSWFVEPSRSIFEAIRNLHHTHPGRKLPWADVQVKLRGKPGFDRIKTIYTKTHKQSAFIRQQQLASFLCENLLRDIVEDLAQDQTSGKAFQYEEYIRRLEDAQRAGSLQTSEIDYFETSLADRIKEVAAIPIVPFPSTELTNCLDGGMAAGQLITILSRTDGGKTMFSINCGRVAAEMGLNVLHVSSNRPSPISH